MTLAQLEHILVLTLLTVCGFLLSRQLSRGDAVESSIKALEASFNKSIASLNQTVGGLALSISELKMWTSERFVTQKLYDKDQNDVYEHIREHSRRAEEAILHHREDDHGYGSTAINRRVES